VLSGLLSSQASAALAAYRLQGLALDRRILLDGWATLLLARRARTLHNKAEWGARLALRTSTGKSDRMGTIAARLRHP